MPIVEGAPDPPPRGPGRAAAGGLRGAPGAHHAGAPPRGAAPAGGPRDQDDALTPRAGRAATDPERRVSQGQAASDTATAGLCEHCGRPLEATTADLPFGLGHRTWFAECACAAERRRAEADRDRIEAHAAKV